jgi:glc operon protein GlcG
MPPTSHRSGPSGVLSLAACEAAIAAVTTEAGRRAIGIVVALAAPSGDLIALARMDDVPPLAAESAMRKCRTVAMTWQTTEAFAASLKGDLETEPEYFHGMHHVGPLMTIGGGVPVVADGALLGIIGVSGATTPDDIALAELGAAAAVAGRSGS